VKLLFCVAAERGFDTGSTRCEIGLGLLQAAPSGWRCPCGEARCEAFAQRVARKN
jgi:hypothetical protein